MNFKETAARLIEQIYNLKGTNQANEAQKLIEDKLIEASQWGATCTLNTLKDTLND